jgi:hypothetical protein
LFDGLEAVVLRLGTKLLQQSPESWVDDELATKVGVESLGGDDQRPEKPEL